MNTRQLHKPPTFKSTALFIHTAAYLVVILSLLLFVPTQSQNISTAVEEKGTGRIFRIGNAQVECTVKVDTGLLQSDRLAAVSGWAKKYGPGVPDVETDADFQAEIMWTDWQAPKKVNNAENPISLRKTDFRFDHHEFAEAGGDARELRLYFRGTDHPLLARISYQLGADANYIRRCIALRDTTRAGHFLQEYYPTDALITGSPAIVKPGGFGQPIALRFGQGGAFFGLEYPAADNQVLPDGKATRLRISQEMGERIGDEWLTSDWVVEGITPDAYVKLWFGRYLNDIRVAPLKPYTLYNSWYDLRSPEYPKVPEGNVMNEKNVMHIIDLIRRNMIEKHGITLDAFVLDDGWDVYQSDWVLRSAEFPRGLKPIADELGKTNTKLGVWFGPIGGYSFRSKRIGYMKEHGYEVVGDQLCLAGTKYHSLFTQRVTDFARLDGVRYYKWDGIQFSCSEAGHGHPVGIYSRRAVMESLAGICRSVRAVSPDMFLNITSGTWLSPWWLRYANQIWMQGEDYGYADVPSISPRDAAITYRDFVLFDDFKNNNMWFPIANLMTHGIIKGNLEKLGGEQEPLDKFTNEALLYVARGVSMWELYISPDILTDGEWNAMSRALSWAKDRFSILSSTEMIGGDPTKRQAYGYIHCRGAKSIIAARNPWIERSSLNVELSPAYGVDPSASSLVLERVYPTRWISPILYRAGSKLDIPLEGFETAIYEVYPLSDSKEPLLAGAVFDGSMTDGGEESLKLYEIHDDVALLNPAIVRGMTSGGQAFTVSRLKSMIQNAPPLMAEGSASLIPGSNRSELRFTCTIDQSGREVSLAVLLNSDHDLHAKHPAELSVTIDGTPAVVRSEKQEGPSHWYSVNLSAGKHEGVIRVAPGKEEKSWTGNASIWIVGRQDRKPVEVTVSLAGSTGERPMPPKPYPPGETVRNIKIGDLPLTVTVGQ